MEMLKVFKQSLEAESKSDNTIKKYVEVVEEMLSIINKPVEEIKFMDLKLTWVKAIKDKNADSTYNLKVNALKKFFSTMIDFEFLEKDPSEKLELTKVDNVQDEYLTKEQIKTLIDTCKNTRLKAMILIMATTGVRVSELININLDDYLNGKVVVDCKGGKTRELTFTQQTNEAIEAYLPNRKEKDGCKNLFTSNVGLKLNRQNISTSLKTLGIKCGIEADIMHPHIFRAMFTTSIATEYGIQVAQRILKHSSITTTSRYTRLQDDVKKQAELSVVF
ncbi:MAG: tyrosine-type recombinase/integrase [Bacteroidales bacterium]